MPHIFFSYKKYFPSPDLFEFPLKNRPYIDWNLRKSWEQIEKKRERTTSKRLQNWMKTESLQQTESIEVYKRWYCIQLHRSEAVLKLIRYFRTFFPIFTAFCTRILVKLICAHRDTYDSFKSSILNIMLSNDRTWLLFENEYYQSVVWTAKLLSSLWWLILFAKMKRNEWIGTEQTQIERTNDGNKYGKKERKKKSYELEWHYESARIVWTYTQPVLASRENWLAMCYMNYVIMCTYIKVKAMTCHRWIWSICFGFVGNRSLSFYLTIRLSVGTTPSMEIETVKIKMKKNNI